MVAKCPPSTPDVVKGDTASLVHSVARTMGIFFKESALHFRDSRLVFVASCKSL